METKIGSKFNLFDGRTIQVLFAISTFFIVNFANGQSQIFGWFPTETITITKVNESSDQVSLPLAKKWTGTSVNASQIDPILDQKQSAANRAPNPLEQVKGLFLSIQTNSDVLDKATLAKANSVLDQIAQLPSGSDCLARFVGALKQMKDEKRNLLRIPQDEEKEFLVREVELKFLKTPEYEGLLPAARTLLNRFFSKKDSASFSCELHVRGIVLANQRKMRMARQYGLMTQGYEVTARIALFDQAGAGSNFELAELKKRLAWNYVGPREEFDLAADREPREIMNGTAEAIEPEINSKKPYDDPLREGYR